MPKVSFYLLVLIAFFSSCNNDFDYPFQNPNLSTQDRVDDLVSRMTLEEKVSQLVYESPAVERLGVPEYNWWNECLHGVGRAGKATVFPQAIGMAAAFDTNLMLRIGDAISDEARAKHHEAIRRGKRGIYQGLTFWTPNINIFRDPRWGRGMETYGEDPYLTGELAVSFIKGLQGNDPNYFKTIATAKHFVVHSGPESSRHYFDAQIGDRDFWETYTPHFKAAVERANVQSVMCAYNRFDGEACCGSSYLLNDLLRNVWGFKGYVVSDCWALVDFYAWHKVSKSKLDASALALKSGTDLNCGEVFPSLVQAIDSGLIAEFDVDIALKRLLTSRFQLGMFDSDKIVPYVHIPYDIVNCEKHQKLAIEAAQKSMVLLKNENKLLPLSKNLKTIAVIGPNADDEDVLLANYNGHPEKAITPLKGIRKKLGENTDVLYARGCDLAEGLPYLTPVPAEFLFVDKNLTQKGLKASFYDNITFQGSPVSSEIHDDVNFNWWENAPVENVSDDNFGVRWTGYILAPKSGEYYLGGDGMNGYSIYLNEEQIVEFYARDMNLKKYKKVMLQGGVAYKIRIDYYNTERTALMKFVWQIPEENKEKQALDIANKADVVIMFMGLSPRLEGEEMDVEVEGFKGGDRIALDLPDIQIKLMKKLKETGKPLVLVLLNGSALAINWESENIPAILEAWYPGQSAGTAIADILFGDYNPSGKLPVTFYKSADDLPNFENYEMDGRTYRYFNKEPLYPFGFGLSYANFEYSNLILPDKVNSTEGIRMSVEVKNNSNIAGEEVVQLYIKDIEASVPIPNLSLKGVQRVFLNAGEAKRVEFNITPDMLALYNDDMCHVVESGVFEISVGGLQPYFNKTKVNSTQVVTKSIYIE